jgi:uncharacterized protein (DUF697 family)
MMACDAAFLFNVVDHAAAACRDAPSSVPLKELLMKLDNLPSYVDPKLNLELIRTECLAMAKKRAFFSAGASTIPIPFFDVVIDAGILTELLPEISARFGLAPEPVVMIDLETRDVDWREVRSRGLTFAGLVTQRGIVRGTIQGFGMRMITRQVVKFIPLGGTIVAATMGYTVFKKIAGDHVDKCYKTALDIQGQSISLDAPVTLLQTVSAPATAAKSAAAKAAPAAAKPTAPRTRKPAAPKTAATTDKAPTSKAPAAPKVASPKPATPKATAAKPAATKASAPKAPGSAPKAPAKRAAAKKPTPPTES